MGITISPVTNPTMYCRKCGYVLDGLSEDRCPECGQAFDPANKHTFCRRPRSLWRRVIYRSLITLLIVLLPGLGLWGWLDWQHQREQSVIKVIEQGGGFCAKESIIGLSPYEVNSVLRSITESPLLQTVTGVAMWVNTTDAELVNFSRLKNLQLLYLTNTQVTDAGLVHLAGLKNLRQLFLTNTHVTDAGVDKLCQAFPSLAVRRDSGFHFCKDVPSKTNSDRSLTDK